MRKLILASHGSLAEGMASAVRMILGDAAELSCFSLDHYVSPQEIGEAVRGLVEAEPETRFLLLSDIKGGSVHNQLFPLCKRPNVQLVSGMNLSLTLELDCWGKTGRRRKASGRQCRSDAAIWIILIKISWAGN